MTFLRTLRPFYFLACALGVTACGWAQSLTVSTLAGELWNMGGNDGSGASARFSSGLSAIVIDAAGNLYVNDANNYTVRKVTPAGVVTTIAGSPGVRAFVNATGTAARFQQPVGLARDAAGNLYIGDWDWMGRGPCVRRISPSGVVTTFISGLTVRALAIDAKDRLIIAVDNAGGTGWTVRAFALTGVEYAPDGSLLGTGTPDRVTPPVVGNFGSIRTMAVAPDRTVYVVDDLKHEVRKITPAGVMTSLAGAAGIAGYADGTGANARFNYPKGIALDSAGNLLVVDNSVLRRITPAGVVTTIAGRVGNNFGPYDGVGAEARFAGPWSVAVAPDGTVYIGDLGAIRKAAVVAVAAKVVAQPQAQTVATGERTTFSVAANGYPAVSYQWQRQPANSSTWSNVADGAAYSGANAAVLVLSAVTPAMNGDRFRCLVSNSLGSDTSAVVTLQVDPPIVVVPLRVSTLAGRAGISGSTDGSGDAARFAGPNGIAVGPDGNIYVSDQIGNRIRKISPTGNVTTLAGSGVAGLADGPGMAAQFRQPGAIAIDAQGNLLVADQPADPYSAGPPIIRRVTPAGVVTTFARTGAGGAPFRSISALVFERTGHLVVADGYDGGILQRITPAGVATAVPTAPTGGSFLSGIGGLAIDAAGTLHLATNSAIFKLTAESRLTTVAGNPNLGGAVDGRASIARFHRPTGLVFDGAGNLFVLEVLNNAIRKITPAGIVSTVASIKPTAAMSDTAGAVDGLGATARFRQPRGMAIDRAGNLYVADYGNRLVRRATPIDAVAAGQSAELYVQTSGDSEAGVSENSSSGVTPAGAGEPRRAALASGVSYQWFKDSVAIPGATQMELKIETASVSDRGYYSVQVMTREGASMSEAVLLSVTGSRLVNLSIRSRAGTGAQTLVVGFVVEGKGLPLLVRGIGPALASLGVASPLSNPRLALFAGDVIVGSNQGWGAAPDLADTAARVGAFALPPTSADAAVMTALDDAAFTAQCVAADGTTGSALVEIYDANVSDAGRSRLVNVSARSQVGTGDDIMIAGFAISGSQPRKVLLRGVGPALAQFSVGGVLADPQLKVFDAAAALKAQNDNWGDSSNVTELAAAMQAVGAFPLPAGGKDAALLLSLAPGSYSVHLTGAGNTTGVGLIEVYEAR